MGEQVALFDVAPVPSPSEAPHSTTRPKPVTRRRLKVVRIQTAIPGVDEYAEEFNLLAEMGGPSKCCPWEMGETRCWWWSCPHHLRQEIGNESAQLTDEELLDQWEAAEYHCKKHHIADHPYPEITPQETLAELMGVSRQTMGDRLEEALKHLQEGLAWLAEERGFAVKDED